jgi:hypothetical protein
VLVIGVLGFGLQGCVSARMSDRKIDQLFRESKYHEASEYLKAQIGASGPGSPGSEDELLYLLDAGLALHQAGEYEASNAYFALAEKHAGLNDYTSVSEEVGTLLTGENTKVYRGELFEKVLIHVYKALNDAVMGKIESALVEARLVHRRLEEIRAEGEPLLQQNAFARYLSAVLYEAEGEWNDAYVDYKKTRELLPQRSFVGRDLWRVAGILGMPDEMERWKAEYSLQGPDIDRKQNGPLSRRSGLGEVIVIFQNGLAPEKRPDPFYPSIPRFVARFNPVSEAEVFLDGRQVGKTQVLHDVEATAIANLDQKKAAIIAKRLAGRVAKAVVADQVRRRTNNEVLGALTELVLVLSDQADTRSWSLLPRDFQIFRIAVEPGTHDLQLRPIGASNLPAKTIQVAAGKKVFVSFRYMP